MLLPRADSPTPGTYRYLPHVVLATLAVVALPLGAVSAIELAGGLRFTVLSMLMAVGLSVCLSSLGAACWKRHPGSRDIVFGDLMLWAFIRRLRAERRLSHAAELLGDSKRNEQFTPDERVKLLEHLSASLEARDAYTHGHTRRVARHSEAIARRMGLTKEQIAMVRTAAAVHDIGKLRTPRWILTKPGPLTDAEFERAKRHTTDGAAMVQGLDDETVAAVVRHHHERLDGSGYPDGLRGTEIPLGARIVAVADSYDAMTSTRPYRQVRSHREALDVLSGEAGVKLDRQAVAAFLAHYSGRRTAAWSSFAIAAPQRLLAWRLESGAASVANGLAAVAVAALIGASLIDPVPGGRASPEPGTEQPVTADSARGGVGAAKDRDREPAASRARPAPAGDVGPPSRRSPDTRTRLALEDSSGGGSQPVSPGPSPRIAAAPAPAPAPAPAEVSVAPVRTPEASVEVRVPSLPPVEAQVPAIEVPGVRVPLPQATLPALPR